MAHLLSILAWRIPWTEEPDGLQSREGAHKKSETTEQLTLSLFPSGTKILHATEQLSPHATTTNPVL